MNRIWLAHEDDIIRADRAAGVKTPVTAAKLDRPVPATFNRAIKIGATYQIHTPWTTEARDQLIAAMARNPQPTDAELSAEFGRPQSQVRSKLAELKLTGSRRYRTDVPRSPTVIRDPTVAEARAALKLAARVAARTTKLEARAARKAEHAQARAAAQLARATARATTRAADAAARAAAQADAAAQRVIARRALHAAGTKLLADNRAAQAAARKQAKADRAAIHSGTAPKTSKPTAVPRTKTAPTRQTAAATTAKAAVPASAALMRARMRAALARLADKPRQHSADPASAEARLLERLRAP